MPSFCVVANCEHKYAQSATISFHKFPFHTTELLQQWMAFTERGPLWKPSRWSSICSRHFLASDYRDHIFRKCLKRSAVPSVRVRQPFDTVLHFDAGDERFQSSHQVMVPRQSTAQPKPQAGHTTSTSATLQLYCRLCARNDPGTRNLDEVAIGQAFQKSFPNLVLDPDVRMSRQVCCDCLVQLNGVVQFIDRIVATQTELNLRLGSLSTLSTSLNEYREVSEAAVLSPETVTKTAPAVRPPTLIVSSRTPATTNFQLPKIVHIKQEPLQLLANVKQEFVDSHRTATVSVAQPIKYPPCLEFQPDNDAFCEFCDVYFINNLELKTHIINYHNSTDMGDHDEQHQTHESQTTNHTNSNCEIMEIITLENAFINLAEETEPSVVTSEDLQHHVASEDMIPLERVLKVEHFNDYEQRELQSSLIRREHSYSRRSDSEDVMFAAHSARNGAALQDCRIFKQEIKALETTHTDSAQVLHTISMAAHQQWSSLSVIEPLNKPEESQDPLSMYQCNECPYQCLLLIELQQHIETDHRIVAAEVFTCVECSDSFSTRLQRLLHRFRAHRASKSSSMLLARRKPIILHCSNCAQKFTTKAAWKNHRMVCDRWHRRLTSFLRSRVSPRSRVLNRIRCLIVRRMWGQNVSAGRGKESVVGRQMNTTQSNGRFVCRSCGRNYAQIDSYHRHLKLHKPYKADCDTSPTAEPPPNICAQQLLNQTDVTRTSPIPSCPATTDTPSDAKQMRRPQATHYTCDICGAQFAHLLKYKHHLSSVHAVAKPYACVVCDKRFRCAENLRQHATTHSTERKHECTLCDKVFKRLAGLKQHVKGFHYKIRPHVCQVCSYAFALKGDMKRCRHSTLKTE